MADSLDAWDANLETLQKLTDNVDKFHRRALKAAAVAVQPRLVEATPLRVSEKQGGNSLPEGTLKQHVVARVLKDKETGRLQAVIDFGYYNYLAGWVDEGHNPPYTKLALKLGRKVTGKPTPAHPFVRAVQDAELKTAQAAYAQSMSRSIDKLQKRK